MKKEGGRREERDGGKEGSDGGRKRKYMKMLIEFFQVD